MNIAVKRLQGRQTDTDMFKRIFRSEGRQLQAKGEEREKIQRKFIRKGNKDIIWMERIERVREHIINTTVEHYTHFHLESLLRNWVSWI